ncbi:hypothetical protein CJU90_5512 [Yarrowia sp. C11]|nr:hypothetical protein CJU90_5512 [Yarrowia sp. C11]KAG5364101.1 hypothetical protein CKK34_2890 [Yarrowia sp. E02]
MIKEETTISEEVATTPIVKRGRGRPPKVPTGDEETDSTPKVKRGRGRPPKVRPEGEEPAVKRPRGRPRKVVDPNDPNAGASTHGNALNASGEPVEKRGRGRPRKNPLPAGPAPLWPTPDLVQFGGADPYEEIDSLSVERIEEQAGQEGASLTHPEKLALIKRRLHAEAQEKDLLEALATNRVDFFNTDETKDIYSQYSVLRHQVAQLLNNYGDTEEGRVAKRSLGNLMGVLRYLRLKDNILSELLTIVPLIQNQDFAGAKTRIQALDGPWCIGTSANREIRLRESQKWATGLVQLLDLSDASYNGLYRV